MPLYAIVSLGGSDESLISGIESRVDSMYDKYAPVAWFVTFDGTTNELADLIWPDSDVDDPDTTDGVVIRMSDCTGYTYHEFWDWLKVHRRER